MMNEILGVGARVQQLLTRRFGIIGGAPSPQLTPEITPEFSLESGAESRLLLSEVLAAGVINQAAVAGQPGAAALFNPAGSNQILVVTHIELVLPGAGGTLKGGIGTGILPYAGLPLANGITYRDTRTTWVGSGTKAPAGTIRSGTNVITPEANLFSRALGAAGREEYNEELVIGPGAMVAVFTSTVNIQLLAAFSWREVPLAPGEVGPF